ncbi:14945_t:CDS:2, partial [Funneliformis geosporum]
GYNSQDIVSLRLDEALREIKSRGRGIPVDGIYSILGLLPYDLKTEWATYFKEDAEEALVEVMKAAIKNGYGEPLAWFGSGKEKQRNGSTKVVGGMHIKYIVPKDKSGNIIIYPDEVITNKGIKIHGSKYTITSCGESIDRVDEKSVVDGGLYRREAEVDIGDSEAFAILMSGNHRIDLVRLGGEVEELRGKGGEPMVIGMDDKHSERQYQAQIEIPIKGNN